MINGTMESIGVLKRPEAERDWQSRIEVTLERIDPQLAKAYLEHNRFNYRKKNKRNCRKLVSDMKQGRWSFTHATIAFDVNGHLVDGQHRLAAIVESGRTGFWFLVVRGMPEGSTGNPSIDTGMRRSVATHLDKHGVVSASVVAATARLLFSIRAGSAENHHATLTDAHIAEVVMEHPSIEIAASMTSSCRGICQGRVVAAWYWLVQHEDEELADECVRILGGQQESVTSHPFVKCREMFLSLKADKTSKTSSDYLIRILMSAWHRAKRGESVKVLRPTGSIVLPQAAKLALAQL